MIDTVRKLTILRACGLRPFFLLILVPFCCQAVELRACLRKIQDRDTVCRVWVLFKDKDTDARRPLYPSHTLARRAKAGFTASTAGDLPVSRGSIQEVEQSGGVIRNVFSWANAASFSIPAAKLPALALKKCVREILPIRTFVARAPRRSITGLQKTTDVPDSGSYGQSLSQLRMIGVPDAHNYIFNSLNQAPGAGVIIGLFDSGFRLNHRCFGYLKSHQSVIADSNFVDRNGEVSDPDSIRRAFLSVSPYSPPEEHGSQTLSLIAGYDPGNFIGVAWGARFVLARTEWVGFVSGGAEEVDVEVHGEEDNFAAALVWAESLGVDIVSSSLGYGTGFTDSSGNPRPEDDYEYKELDGKTTIISRAALEATKRGMIIVNSMGNEGPGSGSLNAPADVEEVVAVGGVDYNKSVCGFSGRGPTSDGRIKPDLVALATSLYLPNIYSSDSAAYSFGGQGTSFAAPFIAGICGLIRQTHPGDPASDIRRRLYASCSFAPLQDSVDNDYGRGIPIALKACFSDSLTPVAGVNFKLYPTTLDLVRKKHPLTFELRALPDDPLHYSQQLIIVIRSMSGKLVWGHTEYLKEREKVKISWPETQKSYAPGMYYFIVNYAGRTITKKFIILG